MLESFNQLDDIFKTKITKPKTIVVVKAAQDHALHSIIEFANKGNLIPILIQAPFISGLYFTLQNPIYSKDILDSSFLSISLGEKSYILLILVFVIYMIVGKISQSMMQSNPMSQNTPEAERIQNVSKNMVWITPIMLTFLTYTSIAAIGIYFVVSGILVAFQILLGRKLYPPYVPKPVKTSNKQKTKLVKR